MAECGTLESVVRELSGSNQKSVHVSEVFKKLCLIKDEKGDARPAPNLASDAYNLGKTTHQALFNFITRKTEGDKVHYEFNFSNLFKDNKSLEYSENLLKALAQLGYSKNLKDPSKKSTHELILEKKVAYASDLNKMDEEIDKILKEAGPLHESIYNSLFRIEQLLKPKKDGGFNTSTDPTYVAQSGFDDNKTGILGYIGKLASQKGKSFESIEEDLMRDLTALPALVNHFANQPGEAPAAAAVQGAKSVCENELEQAKADLEICQKGGKVKDDKGKEVDVKGKTQLEQELNMCLEGGKTKDDKGNDVDYKGRTQLERDLMICENGGDIKNADGTTQTVVKGRTQLTQDLENVKSDSTRNKVLYGIGGAVATGIITGALYLIFRTRSGSSTPPAPRAAAGGGAAGGLRPPPGMGAAGRPSAASTAPSGPGYPGT